MTAVVELLLASGGGAAVLVLLYLRRASGRRGALDRLRDRWGVPRARHHDTDLAKVALYHRRRGAVESHLDDQTWDDLGLDEVFLRVDHTQCGAGQQHLYHLLRSPSPRTEPLDRLEALVQALEDAPAARERAQLELARLDRKEVYYVPNLFLDGPPSVARVYWAAPFLSLGAVALLAGSFLHPPLILGALAVVAVNLVMHQAFALRIQPYVLPLRVVSLLISTGSRLARHVGAASPELAAELRASAGALAPLRRAAAYLRFEGRGDDLVSVLIEYVNMVLLLQVNVYLLCARLLRAGRSAMHRLHAAIGRVDAAISVASYRSGLAHYCPPEFTPAGQFECAGLVHPLLDDPVPNALRVDGAGVLVTGSNMAGKTTFIRAVALNAVLAQTLHTCTAHAFRAPLLQVRTFINRRDDLLEGRSYFFAEVLAVRDLLRQAERPAPTLFVVDELFKGTNTAERLAASKAVLDALLQDRHLVLASTHDLELAALLERDWVFYHFREDVHDGELSFDYRIRPGLSSSRNALRLLRVAGLPPSVVADAFRVIERPPPEGAAGFGVV